MLQHTECSKSDTTASKTNELEQISQLPMTLRHFSNTKYSPSLRRLTLLIKFHDFLTSQFNLAYPFGGWKNTWVRNRYHPVLLSAFRFRHKKQYWWFKEQIFDSISRGLDFTRLFMLKLSDLGPKYWQWRNHNSTCTISMSMAESKHSCSIIHENEQK